MCSSDLSPRNVVATAGDSSVSLTWSAPSSNGGTAVSAYLVEQSLDGLNWTTLTDAADPVTKSYTATLLSNGTAYRFRVSAVTAAGAGAHSVVRTATPTA